MTDTRTCTLCSWPTDREHSGTYILTLVQTSGGINSQRRELTICDHCLEHRDTIATIGRGREGRTAITVNGYVRGKGARQHGQEPGRGKPHAPGTDRRDTGRKLLPGLHGRMA